MPTTRNRSRATHPGQALAKNHVVISASQAKVSPANKQPFKKLEGSQQQYAQPLPASGGKRKAGSVLPPRPKKQKGVRFADEECIALESQCLEPAALPHLICKVSPKGRTELDSATGGSSFPARISLLQWSPRHLLLQIE